MTQTNVLARRRALMAKLQTEGAEAAYEAALAVCRDQKAPAPARATCATTLFRAGGFFAVKHEEVIEKQPHEMTAAEIEAQLAHLAQLRETADDVPNEPGVFD